MIVARLPYRFQIPLGLVAAVVLAALLVTAVAAQISARNSREATLGTVDRVAAVLGAQALPLLAADDTWRVYQLARSTADLLPGAREGLSRAAVLDAHGRVFAASAPTVLRTGQPAFDASAQGGNRVRNAIDKPDGGIQLVDAIRSEDGQVLGFTYIEVDAPAFAPDWAAVSKPALIGTGLALAVLLPSGWWIGRRMTRPVVRLAQFIERIGRDDPARLRGAVPRTSDPELGRIGAATEQLLAEMQVRQRAEHRAISAQRMAAIGRMTAAVAHEINNPLGGLLNAVQTLSLHGDSENTRSRTLELLKRGLVQIQTTVAALVPQARIEDREFQVLDLEDVATLAGASAPAGVKLTTVTEIRAPIHAGSAMLRQVSLNLLMNACKAAGASGTVHAELLADAETIRLCVQNSGARMSAAALQEAIESESGNDPRGFGLWVCRELATQFAGEFNVDEAFASGTRLVFRIPNRHT